ncbi:MAG: PQQ-binding-like beta-propeller repeat protein [Planctomycetota bacterium]
MRRYTAFVGSIVFGSFALGSVAFGQQPADWTQWRGPNRDWIFPETAWASKGAERPVWEKELGLGYAAPVFKAGLLYTTGFDLNEDEQTGFDVTYCLDATTGREIWTTRVEAGHMANAHTGGTLSTPTIDGDVMYTINRFGHFFCRNIWDGAVVWERHYGEDLGLEPTTFGFSSSPLLLGDELIVTMGGTTICVAKDSGEIVWQTKEYGAQSYSNPVPMTIGGRDAVAVLAGPGLLIADRATGEELHFIDWVPAGGGVNIATPVVDGETIFLATGYNHGSGMYDFSSGEPELLWRNRFRNKIGDTVIFDGFAYGFDESMLSCIDLSNGERKWRVRGLGLGSIAGTADGRLIVISAKGELIVAQADPEEYRELSRAKVLSGQGEHWTTPAIYGGLVYVRNNLGTMVCLDHRGADDAAGESEAVALPPAAELFAAHTAGVGGADAWADVASIAMEGSYRNPVEMGTSVGAFQVSYLFGTAWLLDVDVFNMNVLHGFDGEHGYLLHPFFGERVLEGDELDEARRRVRYTDDVLLARAYGDAETVGTERFADRDCWVVRATARDGTARTLYFDRETEMLAGRTSDTESVFVFSDYQPHGGVSLPRRVSRLDGETGNEEVLVVESVTLNTVTPEAFEKPDGLLKLLMTPEEAEAKNAAVRARVEAYVGSYKPATQLLPGDVVVLVDAGAFMIQFAPGMQFPMTEPDADGVSKLIGMPESWVVTFVRDADGRVVSLTGPMQDGSTFEATRGE